MKRKFTKILWTSCVCVVLATLSSPYIFGLYTKAFWKLTPCYVDRDSNGKLIRFIYVTNKQTYVSGNVDFWAASFDAGKVKLDPPITFNDHCYVNPHAPAENVLHPFGADSTKLVMQRIVICVTVFFTTLCITFLSTAKRVIPTKIYKK